MTGKRARLNPLFSLKTQLVAGAIVLLGLTVGSISYTLVVEQKRILTDEIRKTIVYQGRNLALGCETLLLRTDPEFELYPQVKRMLDQSENILQAVVTDAEGRIQAAEKLTDLEKPFEPDFTGYESRDFSLLVAGETFRESSDSFWFTTPVRNRGSNIGHVHLRYSKISLERSTQRAFSITGVLGTIAFGLSIILTLLLFRRISKPMDTLVRGAERIGLGELNTRIQLNTKNEFSILADSINDMAGRISQAQEELIIKERLDRELEIAREIQATLVPRESFTTDQFEVSFYYKAATEVGGDYVDAFPINERNIALVMADVSGKGVPGLVVMAMLKFMVRDLVNKGLTPRELVRKLNLDLAQNLKPKMFVTFFIAYLNLDTATITYSNAGHNPLMIYDRAGNRCEMFKMDGAPLGVFPDDLFSSMLSEYELTLRTGDLIFQYTDGLSESTNPGGTQFSIENVRRNGHRFASQGAKTFVQQMILVEEEFRGRAEQQDDITFLALSQTDRRTADDPGTTAPRLESDMSVLVHSVDFDTKTIRLDVRAPILDEREAVLAGIVSMAERQGLTGIDIRRDKGLPTDTIALLEKLESTRANVKIGDIDTGSHPTTTDACLYRRRKREADESNAIEYVIRLNEFNTALDRINIVVRLIGASIPLDDKCLSHLEFCIHELVANSVEHAAFSSPKPAIEVTLTPHTNSVRVSYRDNAEPFRPSEQLEVDISGRIKEGKKRGFGIYLIHQFTEEFKHERDTNWNSTMFRIKRDHELQEA